VLPPEFLQQLPFLFAQGPALEEVRPPEPCPSERLLQPPAPDVAVVAGKQHFRHRYFDSIHRPALRPGVLRAIEQPVGEGLLHRRGLVAERPGKLPHHGVDERHGRELPAREDEIADGQLFVHPPLEQPLVDALVPAAKERKRPPLGQFHHPAVAEPPPLRREVDHPAATRGLRRAQRLLERLGQHDHARAAAERTVIDRPVAVRREIPRIPQRQAPQPALERAARDAAFGERPEHFRENRHHVEARHQSAPHATVTRPLWRSTALTTAGTQGSSRFLPSSLTSITSCAPLKKSRRIVPSVSPSSFTTSSPTRSAK